MTSPTAAVKKATLRLAITGDLCASACFPHGRIRTSRRHRDASLTSDAKIVSSSVGPTTLNRLKRVNELLSVSEKMRTPLLGRHIRNGLNALAIRMTLG